MTGYTVAPDYTWNIRINSFEVGPDRRLRLSNQLKASAGGGGAASFRRRAEL